MIAEWIAQLLLKARTNGRAETRRVRPDFCLRCKRAGASRDPKRRYVFFHCACGRRWKVLKSNPSTQWEIQ